MPKMPSMPGARGRSASSKLRKNSGVGAGRLTIILVAVAIVLFTFSVRENGQGPISSVRNVAQTIVSPLRMLGAGITAPFFGMGNVFRNLTVDERTLTELKEENERLAARNVELEEAELTARRLQELLDLRSSYNLQSVAARVISGSVDSWTSSVTIDKGTAAGISVGMPVSDQSAAVGQVMSCGATTSVVRLLSDEGSSVSAMVQSSRAQGMLEGAPDGTLHLEYIRTDQTVSVGDIVVTSGLGGVFPKGLPMGKVSSVETNPGSVYYDIVVEPFTRPGHLEELLVITSLTEEQQASAEDIERADAADLEAASGRSVEKPGATEAGQGSQGSLSDLQNGQPESLGGEAASSSSDAVSPHVGEEGDGGIHAGATSTGVGGQGEESGLANQ